VKVLIIGGGVIGITTAYYLVKAGVSVTLLERSDAAGMEASAGNAGFVSPSDSFAWASPSAFNVAIKSLIHPDLGIKFRPGFDPHVVPWALRFLGQCRPGKWRQNSDTKYRLAEYSLALMKELENETSIQFDALNNGIAYACRDQKALRELGRHFEFLSERGLELRILDQEELFHFNPALKSRPDIYAGAVYSPSCKTGDSRKFSQALVQWCETKGSCRFEWNTEVQELNMSNGKISSVLTSKGEFKADTFVLCAGAYSGILSRHVGIKLPIYPIKGFSISAPIVDPDMAPTTGFDDVQKMVAVSRLGDRIRIASSAVFSGFNLNHTPEDFKSILNLAREVFPDAADYAQAQYWSGLRPMTPSSTPIIGTSSINNLFLNTGHGHLGWTLACASGKLAADNIVGRKPELEYDATVGK
jgi:D-amino-acid dehydrogenase